MLVAVLAVIVDLLIALVQRLVVSPGVDGRATQGRRRRNDATGPAATALHGVEEVAQATR